MTEIALFAITFVMFKLDPAASIIKTCGGPGRVAEVTGADRSTIWRWTRPRALGGTGGIIPHWHVGKLLAHARANDLAISPASFAPQECQAAPASKEAAA